MRKILVAAFVVLASCGTLHDPDPVGVGFDANELKLSPCACLEIEMQPGLPEWFLTSWA